MRWFGELEAAVMEQLWSLPEGATIPQVHRGLRAQRDIAYRTVMSTVHTLHRKGRLSRTREGRGHRYRATVSRAEHSAELMREALGSGGDVRAVLSHFVERIDPEDGRRLAELLDRTGQEPSR